MKKLYLLLFLAICLIPNNINSQSFFREGYIEKNSGDVLNGMIEYKPNQKIPAKCVFKRFDIASRVSYSAEEIKSFGYKNGNSYKAVSIDNKSSFYEVLVLGRITLYKKGNDYFVDKDNTGLIKIENGQLEYPEAGDIKKFKNPETFLAYLTEGKAGELNSKFDINKELLPLIIAYNKVSGKDYYTFNRKFSDKQLAKEISLSGAKRNRFGILTGLNMYNQNLELHGGVVPDGMSSKYVPDSEFETGSLFGISFERSLLRKSDKLALRLDLYYTSQNFYCYEEYKDVTFNRNEAFFDFTTIKAPFLLQYSVPGRRLVPFANAGVAYHYILSSNYRHIEEKENYFNVISTYEDNDFKFKQGEISAVAGIGARFRLMNNIGLNFQTRFEYGSGLFINSFTGEQFGKASYSKPYKQNSIQMNILLGLTF
jgi:hypothetical protein